MTYEDWVEKYQPVTNQVPGGTNTNNDPDYDHFETFDEDLAFVKAQENGCIWTVLDCDGTIVLASGYHYVNRMYYMITAVPFEGDYMEIVLARDTLPYAVVWEGEGDNDGYKFGIEMREYEDVLMDGTPDYNSPCEVYDVQWFTTMAERDAVMEEL